MIITPALKDKVALVTGASRGIGAATALEFARLGARVLMCARRLERLREMEPSLLEAGADLVGTSAGSQIMHEMTGEEERPIPRGSEPY